MFCDDCGAAIDDDAVFCADCGARVSLAGTTMREISTNPQQSAALVDHVSSGLADASSEQRHERIATRGAKWWETICNIFAAIADSLKRNAAVVNRWFTSQEASRFVSGGFLIAIGLGSWLSGQWDFWLMLFSPVAVGAMFPLLRLKKPTTLTEHWEHRFAERQVRAQGKIGKFTRFFTRPLLRGCLAIWAVTRRLSDPHLRAGVRLTIFLYFFGLMVGLLLVVGYVLVMIVLAIIALIVIAWILGKMLGGDSRPSRTRWTPRFDYSPSPPSLGFSDRPRESHKREGWFGGTYLQHTNGEGERVGESRKREDWLGHAYSEHTDAEGQKTGKSREREDWLGRPYTEHRDAEGKKTGESRKREDWLGHPYEEHKDAEGKKTGESRKREDWLGKEYVEHSYEDEK